MAWFGPYCQHVLRRHKAAHAARWYSHAVLRSRLDWRTVPRVCRRRPANPCRGRSSPTNRGCSPCIPCAPGVPMLVPQPVDPHRPGVVLTGWNLRSVEQCQADGTGRCVVCARHPPLQTSGGRPSRIVTGSGDVSDIGSRSSRSAATFRTSEPPGPRRLARQTSILLQLPVTLGARSRSCCSYHGPAAKPSRRQQAPPCR